MMLTSLMVGTLKGAPLACLMVLMIEQRVVNQEYLERYTRYSDKPVSQALMLLKEVGLVSQIGRYGWQIAAGVEQLPLMAALDTAGGQAPADPVTSAEETSRKYSDSSLESSSSGHIEIKQNGPLLEKADPEKFRLNLAACDEAKIREPARSRLANLNHVYPELIAYHARTCSAMGQAIFRIEKGWRIIQDEDEGEDRKKYISGKFSDFIIH